MPTCFVIMPITTPAHLVDRYGGDDQHFLHVFTHLFRPALEQAGFDAVSPVSSGSDVIQGEIIKNLNEADLVLCDMSSLNANVFFELGIRTALDKPVATVRDTFTDRIPFDHSIVNCHTYRWQLDPWILDEEIPKLAGHITSCVERGGATNTLWKYFGIEAQARVGSGGTTDDDKLDYVVRQIEDLRSDLRDQRATGGVPARLRPLHFDRSASPAVQRFLTDAWSVISRSGGDLVAAQDPRNGTLVLDTGDASLGPEDIKAIVEAAVMNEVTLEATSVDVRVRDLFQRVGCGVRPTTTTGGPVGWSEPAR